MSELGGLQRDVAQVHRAVQVVTNQVAAVSQQVGVVAAEQTQAKNELGQLRADFLRFVQQAEFTANVQRAETKKGQILDQLEHQFGHHKVVRRTATGLLQAFDLGIVSEETVRGIAEELMLQTPRYWLAPALVGLAAWSADDADLCERAVAEAFRRSPSHTSLFFCLILRRQARHVASHRWLRHYLDALDPMHLDRNFAVILEAVAHGAFGAAGQEMIQERLSAWQERLTADPAAIASQVARWREEVAGYLSAPHGAQFPKLAAVSPQWPQLDAALCAAETHGAVVTKYRAMLDEEVSLTVTIEDAVDDILDRLVREYDVEELPLKRELDQQEAVLRAAGDLDRAKHTAGWQSAARDDTLDYLTVQSTAALLPERIGVSRATQRVAVAACEPWFAQAHAEFTQEYRGALPTDVQAKFDSSHNLSAKAFKLTTWTGSFAKPLPELERSLAEHWDKTIDPFLRSMRYDWEKAALLPVLIIGALFVVFAAGGAVGPGLTLAAMALLVLGGVLYFRNQAAEKGRLEAERALQSAKRESLAQLRQAGAELTDWTSAFRASDGQEAEVRRLLADLRVAGHAATPFEQRSMAAVQPRAAGAS